jgi:type IV secretory pathway TraG/TraD family ATPase VirD4
MSAHLTIAPGRVLKTFSLLETTQLKSDWMRVYCAHHQGVNVKSYHWHIFSSGRFPSVSGDQATQEYLLHSATEFLILPNDKTLAILTDIKPSKCNLSDYYVFPPNMAWVMAFTHEAGWLGPYFAKHPDYDALNANNMAVIKKAHEKSLAIQKGWATD